MTIERRQAQHRSAQQWFAEADRCYIEEHQGCPCCRGRHCVFRAQWGRRTEYHCNECDFSAAHDDAAGTFAAIDGQAPPTVFLEGVWGLS